MPHRSPATDPRVLRELLAEAGELRLVVAGASMHPAIRQGDSLVVRPLARHPRLGDVVVFARGGQLWCHRVLLAGRRLLTKGDARGRPDALVAPDDVIGLAIAVQRGNRILGLGGLRARLAGLAVSLVAPAAALGRRLTGRTAAAGRAGETSVNIAGFEVRVSGPAEMIKSLYIRRAFGGGGPDFSVTLARRVAATGGGRYGVMADGRRGRFTLVSPAAIAHLDLHRRTCRAELVAGYEADGAGAVLRILGILIVNHLGDGLALHASAVRHGAGAWLFAGVGGAGKSTARRLACQAGARPLADDLVLLRPGEAGRWLAWGPPLDPELENLPEREPAAAHGVPVAALLAPARGSSLSVERLSAARWLALAASFPPAPLAVAEALERLARLAESAPAWRVRFANRRGGLDGLFEKLAP